MSKKVRDRRLRIVWDEAFNLPDSFWDGFKMADFITPYKAGEIFQQAKCQDSGEGIKTP